MPHLPAHPCAHPGCPALIPGGKKYCVDHASMHRKDIRSAAAQWYDAKWRKAWKRFLESHPLCEECKMNGRYVAATDVDHIIAHRGDQQLFWDQNNLRALCHSCHSKKTAREDMHPEYKY